MKTATTYRQQYCPKAGRNVVWDTSDTQHPVCLHCGCNEKADTCPIRQDSALN